MRLHVSEFPVLKKGKKMRRISLHSEKNWIRMKQKPKIYQNTELGSTFTRHDRLWKVCLKSVSALKACGSGENMGGI